MWFRHSGLTRHNECQMARKLSLSTFKHIVSLLVFCLLKKQQRQKRTNKQRQKLCCVCGLTGTLPWLQPCTRMTRQGTWKSEDHLSWCRHLPSCIRVSCFPLSTIWLSDFRGFLTLYLQSHWGITDVSHHSRLHVATEVLNSRLHACITHWAISPPSRCFWT